MSSNGGDPAPVMNELADRGARLFEYLAKVQSLRTSRIQDIATYQREGEVIWIGELPEHAAVTYQQAEPGKPFLMVQKVNLPAAPDPGSQLRRWLDSGWDKPDNEPALRSVRTTEAGQSLRLADNAEISTVFGEWLPRWRAWAEQTRPKVAVHRLYQTMYEMYTRYEGATETLEVVLAVGFLTWRIPDTGMAKRHVLTMPVTISFDSGYGGISVAIDPDATGYTAELQEIIDPNHMSAAGKLRQAENEARTGDIDPFDRENAGALVRMFINCINPDSEYADEMLPGSPTPHPSARYAPAVILRRRGNRGMVTALRTIADAIRASGQLPAGIHNLVDPDYVPSTREPDAEGAIVADGADKFLPLPLNDVQLRILDHVDRNAHTLVQGPPGTGKTHTAAALITHLLAQGKRVLITAHTDRALHEVRNKLPDEVKPLCVAVVGDSRQEQEDLKASVNRISHEAGEFDPVHNRETIVATERAIDELRRRRSEINAALMRLREHDVAVHTVAGYSGTLAEIATSWRAERFEFEWITELVVAEPDQSSPVPGTLINEWHALLLNAALADPEAAVPDLLIADDLPTVDEFSRLCAAEYAAAQRRDGFVRYDGDPATARIPQLGSGDRNQVRGLLRDISDFARDLRRRTEPWAAAALGDVHSGHALEWRTRAAAIADHIDRAEKTLAALGYADVQVNAEDPGPLVALAENLLAHIEIHGPLKIRSDGFPKIGLTSARAVKDAASLFDHVRVDGRVPAGVEQLTHFLNYDRGRRILYQLDTVWPAPWQNPAQGPLYERLARHRVTRDLLDQILDYAGRVEYATVRLREVGLPVPDWADTLGVQAAVEAFTAVDAQEAWQRATAPLDELFRRVETANLDPRATANLRDLRQAVRDRDIAAYQREQQRLVELHKLRRAYTRRAEWTELMSVLPQLRDAITADPADPDWEPRLRQFDEAWRWAGAGRWLAVHNSGGGNELCRQLDAVEDGLRGQATVLATTRAWGRAVQRLTLRAQSDLRQYAQLYKGLGKGTGQYAERKRADIQKALANCRSAVPVWIMPIYRVVEQFPITADMFDVVVVDEASQAGAEAVFLQYLAPRIVVIGDDKQVSPSAVGVDESELERLAGQYLFDDRYQSSWKNPKRSLFEEAVMRFPARLTLIEHRRCVPEIIGFSNKIAYEPEGVKLVPVRRYGSDRLAPIRTVHVPDGREESRQVNPNEAERIIAQIEECLEDPRYEGKTFGVISLLGSAQAKYLRQQLMTRIPPEEIERRHLHCGDAADFQGAERDVIFLSLVAAAGQDRRLIAQTTDGIVQRYNVAVSRARDQLWLFHSVTIDQLTNSSDLRYLLLDYCQGIEQQVIGEEDAPQQVPDDHLVEPFESLFEQQVYNGIVERGYRITPHHNGTGFDIDLVVTGGGGQFAIQCDSDRWSGADLYRMELARQRDLERCGWPFHTIRQADFIVDPDRSLGELWELLEHNGIHSIEEEESRRLADLLVQITAPVFSEPDAPELMYRVSLVVIDAEHDGAETRLGACAESGDAGDLPPPSDAPTQVAERECLDEQPHYEESADSVVPDDFDLADVDVITESSDATDHQQSEPVPNAHTVAERSHSIHVYEVFSGTVESPTTASHSAIVADFLRIAAIEGPVTAARLRAAYVTAARTRERDNVRKKLDIALKAAVVNGKLLVDDDLRVGDPALLTYRLPEQDPTSWRELGPRKIEQVPPRELAEMMAHHAMEFGWAERVVLFRAVINAIGQTRLTENAIATLALVLPLAREIGMAG